jgi:D-sedoheptulose 7-phosphate isomerase
MAGEEPATVAVRELFGRRTDPSEDVRADAAALALACREMARRFQDGGRLLAFGDAGAATDAQHVAVEFVHPAVVGKRALPAVSLADDAALLLSLAGGRGLDEVFAEQVRLFGAPGDIALGISGDGRCSSVRAGLRSAHELGLCTVALVGGDGEDPCGIGRDPAVDHALITRSDDPCVVKEMHVTTYHILWELVHVFLDRAGSLEPRPEPRPEPEAAS